MKMRYSTLMLVVLSALGMQMAGATPTAEEAAQLGITGTPLTPFGAIRAGNKEGTIPEWKNDGCKIPADYKPIYGRDIGGGPYVDPYAADKPLFKITAENLAQYKDKVDLGSLELFRRYPKTYYMNVYPTHRSACYPNWVYENTIKNVMKPKLVNSPFYGLVDAHAQMPFPIPKIGVEAMWNMQLPDPVNDPKNQNFDGVNQTWMVDSAGNKQLLSAYHQNNYKAYWDMSQPDNEIYFAMKSMQDLPPSGAGTIQLNRKYLRTDTKGQPFWSYIPGQRRVRLAPEFAYDGVAPAAAGIMLYDEGGGWLGKFDRFDFKLLGRKEFYIAANSSPKMNENEAILTPGHLDPAAVRWELHRVWVVDATLRPGERHVQKEKIFYIDEDSWALNAYVGIDQAGKTDKYFLQYDFEFYDRPSTYFLAETAYSFSKGAYAHWNFVGTFAGYKATEQGHHRALKPYPASLFTPEGVQGGGVR